MGNQRQLPGYRVDYAGVGSARLLSTPKVHGEDVKEGGAMAAELSCVSLPVAAVFSDAASGAEPRPDCHVGRLRRAGASQAAAPAPLAGPGAHAA